MANFLEAIGRTNALSQGMQAITNTALAMRQLKSQETQAGQQKAIQDRQMQLLEAAGEREKIEFDQKQADLNKVTPWDRVVPTMMPTAGAEVQKKITDFFESQGLLTEVSGQKIVTKRNLLQGMELYKNNLTFSRAVDETHLQEIGTQITQLTGQLNNTEKPPSEKEATNIMTKLKALQIERTQVLDTLNTLDQETRKAMATAKEREVKPPDIEVKPISKTMQQKYQFNPTSGQYDIPFGEAYPINPSAEGGGAGTAAENNRINQVRDDARAVVKSIYGTQTMDGFVIQPDRMKEYQETEKFIPEYADKYGGDIGGVLASERAVLGKQYKIIQAKVKEFKNKKIPKEKIIADLEEKGIDARLFKELD